MEKSKKKTVQDEVAELERELGRTPSAAHEQPTGYREQMPREEDLFADAPEEVDAQRFVKLADIGARFTGMFIRLLDLKSVDKAVSKYPGYLFAEYPSGMLKVLPANWSIGEKIAEKEREDGEFFAKHIVRLEVVDIVKKPDGTSVKLFSFRFVPKPEGFAPRWDEQFPNPSK